MRRIIFETVYKLEEERLCTGTNIQEQATGLFSDAVTILSILQEKLPQSLTNDVNLHHDTVYV
jgi:hypothetical protein